MSDVNTYTKGGFIPMLPQDGKDRVILLDWIEFSMSKAQLKRVTNAWNSGIELERIALKEQRKPLEILIALMHQAHHKNKMRPFAFRRG